MLFIRTQEPTTWVTRLRGVWDQMIPGYAGFEEMNRTKVSEMAASKDLGPLLQACCSQMKLP